MDRRLSRVQRSHIHCCPRALSRNDQVAGRSSTKVPQTLQVAGSPMHASEAHPKPYRRGMNVEEEPDQEPQVDPHYLELLRTTKLPEAYLPAAMSGPKKPWVRVAATVVIGVLVLATFFGVCLTYGPRLT